MDLDYEAQLHIDFYGSDSGAVNLIASADSFQEGEIRLFCLFALRQLVNLRDYSISGHLANVLAISSELAGRSDPWSGTKGIRLIRRQDSPGKKRFVCTFRSSGDDVSFSLQPIGFGWFAKGIGFFAAESVLLSLRYLLERRLDDASYRRRLVAAAELCARSFLAGSVGLGNQSVIALTVSALSAETNPESTRPPTSGCSSVHAPIDRSVAEILERNGSGIGAADFLPLFSPGPGVLEFSRLDTPTRIAFDYLARDHAAEFQRACPEAELIAVDDLAITTGKALLDGYIVGRRVLGTHARPVTIASSGLDASALADGMIRAVLSSDRIGLIRAAGEHVFEFVIDWCERYSGEDVYAQSPDRRLMLKTMLATVLDGFALAVAEYRAATK